MIAYLSGRLLEISEGICIIVTEGGVGYEVNIPSNVQANLPPKGDIVELYTSMIVREDAQELYGFLTFEEKQTFEVLITISKVGARTALSILSAFRPQDLHNLVLEDDIISLTRVQGIGKKTAQHIFLELKYKLKVGDSSKISVLAQDVKPGSVYRDVIDGLINLGYSEVECVPILKKVLHEEPDLDVTGALRAVLKKLAKGRS